MPTYQETFLCTAVPQSANGTKLRFAILVSPRLTAQADPGGQPIVSDFLSKWPDALNWAAVLPTWTVKITQGATTVSVPGQEIGAGYDVQTWNAIFPANMATTPYVPPVDPGAAHDPALLPGVATFQAGAVRDAVKDLHVSVLTNFRTQFPLRAQLSDLAQFVPIKNALSPTLVQEVLDAQLTGGAVGTTLDRVFAQLDLFHGARPGSALPAPTITGVQPASGSPSGGTVVTITGTTFVANGTEVFFGGTVAGSVVVVSPTSITCTTPPGTFGAQVAVAIRTPGGVSTATPPVTFTYLDPPTVTKIDKPRGPSAGGGTVTITGTNFVAGNGPDGTPNTTVAFGTAHATNVLVGSDPTSLTCTVPPAGGNLAVNVVVTTKGGSSAASAASAYTYVPLPTVTSVTPASGPVVGGQAVTVTGTNLTGATEIH
ncbi:MAG TPA: IPT/TIG domain-containing protein, partial [Pseudonocardiaceae bacterium]